MLANRLSEDGRHSVLLIEAGGSDRNPVFSVPLLAGMAYFWKSSNWHYETEPQAAMDGRSIKWPRGKVLGGSSTINGMMYMRGNRADYDQWRQMGLAGWSYADVLPYFKRSEDFPERAGDPFHGSGGPLRVRKARAENPLYAAFLNAGAAEGFRRNDDFNGRDQEGLGVYDFNIRDGRRESSATAYLRPAQGRSNLLSGRIRSPAGLSSRASGPKPSRSSAAVNGWWSRRGGRSSCRAGRSIHRIFSNCQGSAIRRCSRRAVSKRFMPFRVSAGTCRIISVSTSPIRRAIR